MKKIIISAISIMLMMPIHQLYAAQAQTSQQPKDQKSKSYWTKVGLAVAGAATAAAVLATGGTYAYQQYQGQKKAEALEKEYQQATRGLGPNSQDYDGDTPLHKAVQQGKVDLVKLMLEKGANTNVSNVQGNTPLIVLYQSSVSPQDMKTITALLVSYRANPCIKNNNQDDAIAFANMLSDEKLRNTILDELRKNTAHCNVDQSLAGVIHAVESQPQALTEEQKKLNALQAKISQRYNIDVSKGVNEFGWSDYTPLMYLASKGDVEFVKLLLEAGADTNLKSKDGRNTALMSVIWDLNLHQALGHSQETRNHYLKIIELLIQYGANPCLKNNNNYDAVDYAKDSTKDEDTKAILELFKQNKVGCVIRE